MPMVEVSNGGTSEVKILYPTVNTGNSWSVVFSGLEVGSQIALGYYCPGNNGFGTTPPSASGAIIKYSNFYNYTYQLNMLLEVTAKNVTVSGYKPNTSYMGGVSWAIS